MTAFTKRNSQALCVGNIWNIFFSFSRRGAESLAKARIVCTSERERERVPTQINAICVENDRYLIGSIGVV